MRVILLESITKVGSMGQEVKVKAGFGRNFLIPQGKAIPATAANLKEFEARRSEFEALAAKGLTEAQQRSQQLAEVQVRILSKAGDEGKLYGAVTARDIADAITAAGVAVSKNEVVMPAGMIRHIGMHPIQVRLHADVAVDLEIEIAVE